MAGAGAVRAGDRGHSEPARSVDPHRQYTLRAWPALFAHADHAIIAANLVHTDGMGRGAVHAAIRGRLVPALRHGMGARRRGAVAAGRRCPYRGGHQAGLPCDPGKARTHAAHSSAAAGAGAVIDRDARLTEYSARLTRPN